MEKIKLTIKEKRALDLIVAFYDKAKKGCKCAGVIFDRKILFTLSEADLVFKTKDGWFPSTKGQEYVKLYGVK